MKGGPTARRLVWRSGHGRAGSRCRRGPARWRPVTSGQVRRPNARALPLGRRPGGGPAAAGRWVVLRWGCQNTRERLTCRGGSRWPGADGASATALQPPPHLLTTLPAPAGGGRCVRHGTAATGLRRRRGTGAAQGRPGRAARAGGGGRGAAGRARRRTRPPVSVSDGQARGRATDRVLDGGSGPARAAMTCRPRPWDGQRVAPVVPAAGTVGRGDGAERRVGGHWSSRPPGRQGVFLGRDRPAVWSWATSTPSGMNPRGLDATPWGCAAGALPRPPGPRTPRPAPPPRPAGGALRPVALGPGVPREGRRPDRRHLENWWTDPRLGRVEVVRGAGNLGRGAGQPVRRGPGPATTGLPSTSPPAPRR